MRHVTRGETGQPRPFVLGSTRKEGSIRNIIVPDTQSFHGRRHAGGGPTEIQPKGLLPGGWVMPYFGQEFGEEIDRPSVKIRSPELRRPGEPLLLSLFRMDKVSAKPPSPANRLAGNPILSSPGSAPGNPPRRRTRG